MTSQLTTSQKIIHSHFCIFFLKLNTVAIQGLYLVPSMEDCIALLRDTTICSTFHANKGYWQDKTVKNDRNKTAFTLYSDGSWTPGLHFGLERSSGQFDKRRKSNFQNWSCRFSLFILEDCDIFMNTWWTSGKLSACLDITVCHGRDTKLE